MKRKHVLLTLLLALALTLSAAAQQSDSLRGVMKGLLERMQTQLGPEGIKDLSSAKIEAFLNDSERAALSSGYMTFDVNVPATVWLACSETPFWLEGAGFVKTDESARALSTDFKVWRKDVPPGKVALGVTGFRGGDRHYFIVVTPKEPGAALEVANVDPERCRTAVCKPGTLLYANDLKVKLDSVPNALDGGMLIRCARDRGDQTKIIGAFRFTQTPAAAAPDQIVLTWNGDPKTTQTVQWRMNSTAAEVVEFRPAADANAPAQTVPAERTSIEDAGVLNDPVCNHFTATMQGLSPATSYAYRVGDAAAKVWSPWETFTTAPAGPASFSFVYLGDAQVNFEDWGKLLHTAAATTPTPAFYIMVGDLVNRGNERDDWDNLFAASAGVYDHYPLVPTVGNHECRGADGPATWVAEFDLPENGPGTLPKERIYSFQYAGAFFVVLDPNLDVEKQAPWLEEQLAAAKDAAWKFAAFHQPVYSSAPNRDNDDIRKAWAPLFERYGVDMVLEGHDHGYLRTYPMKEGQRSTVADGGVYYVVADSGGKYYDQGTFDYAEIEFPKTSTYQVLNIDEAKKTLTYRAYDATGALRDEVIMDKSK